MEYFISGILSLIKVFEVFGNFLFHLSGVMYIPYLPDPEKRKRKRPPLIGSLFLY